MNQTRSFTEMSQRGFTLIELVIVLAVTGLIFAGLWGLMAGGSSQLQAQTAAQQYKQVIAAVRQRLMDGTYAAVAANAMINPPLTIAGLITSNNLPANFSTTDAFGNTYDIRAQAINAANNRFRFMVVSVPGTQISDKTGAQVAALIGSDGGFIYENPTENCAATAADAVITACGAYNSFAINVTAAPFSYGAGEGRIATYTHTGDSNTGVAPYLYRRTGYATEQRTMQHFMYFGTPPAAAGEPITGTSLSMQGNTIHMGARDAPAAGGTLNMASGPITNATSMTVAAGAGALTLNGSTAGIALNTTIGPITLQSGTNINLLAGSPGAGGVAVSWASSPNNTATLFAINGRGVANVFEAAQFMYSASDENMKKNIRPIADALSRILQIRGVMYEWKAGADTSIGLIAQNVESVFPEVVGNASDGHKGIDYAKLVAPLIEAVRQLKQENDSLRREMNAIKADVKKAQ